MRGGEDFVCERKQMFEGQCQHLQLIDHFMLTRDEDFLVQIELQRPLSQFSNVY